MAFVRALHLALLGCSGSVTLAEENVYGQAMTDCGPDHYGGCTYVAGDSGAHEVCVTTLPAGFSSDTGQGPWSDEFTGQPWCICIWAYSNYILQKKDLQLQCKSIPAKVLEEQYSLDKFEQCGKMSSTEGCGPEDIRRSIQSLCTQCDEQAEDATSKAELKSKCDKILASAPAASMTAPALWLKSDATPSFKHGTAAPLSLIGFGLLFAVVSSVMLVRTIRKRRAVLEHERDGLVQSPSAAEDNDDIFARDALMS